MDIAWIEHIASGKRVEDVSLTADIELRNTPQLSARRFAKPGKYVYFCGLEI